MSVFDTVPVDAATRAKLVALAAEPPRGHLLILEAPAGDIGPMTAATLARAMIRDERAKDLDVRVGVPSGDRWTIAEVDDSILAPASLRPHERTVIVVESADMMDTGAAEHLLKTVEEPPGACLFLFVVGDVGALLPTIRGRASAVVQLAPAAAEDRIAALVEAGAEPQVAAETVALAGPLTALAARAATDADTLTQVRVAFGAPLRVTNPTTHAAAVLEAVEHLAVASRGEGKVTKTAKASPEAKAAQRRVIRQLIVRWRAQVSAELPGVTGPAGFAACVRAAAALDAAEAELRVYTSPRSVLAALFSRSAPAS